MFESMVVQCSFNKTIVARGVQCCPVAISVEKYSNATEAATSIHDPSAEISISDICVPEKRGKKRVHFESITENVCTSTTTLPEIDPNDMQHIWWDETALQRRRTLDIIVTGDNSLKHNPAFHESIIFLMKSYKCKYRCREDLTDRLRIVRDTNVRGLEHRIVTPLRVIRRISPQIILMEQKRLRDQGVSSKNEIALLLRRKSLKLSRATRQLAFRLAQLDRNDANTIHKEEQHV